MSQECSGCKCWGAAAHSALQAQVHHLSEECRKARNAAAAAAGELRQKSCDLSHAERRVKRLRQQLEQKHASASSLQVGVVYNDGCVCLAACLQHKATAQSPLPEAAAEAEACSCRQPAGGCGLERGQAFQACSIKQQQSCQCERQQLGQRHASASSLQMVQLTEFPLHTCLRDTAHALQHS